MNSKLAADIEICEAQNHNYLLGDGFYRLISHNNSFALLLRYQAQAERQYRRAIEEFERLKALREELPNEPILAEPETNETTSPSCETNPIPPANPTPAPAPAFQPPAPGPRPPTPGPASEASPPPAPVVDYHVGLQPLAPMS